MQTTPYLVSARKYRPSCFEEVIGQPNITKTLLYALKEGKVPSALLFAGPKGVGKTSCARILARKLNEGADITEHTFNIFEIDGASHNSVEDIRHLIEQIRFAPAKGRYKIYIIDEVHMLSQSAFNAFLKVLEEPPSYVVFILATTERHKVLPTVVSRCQIYEFQPISIEDIVTYLKDIALKEQIQVQEEALFLLASQAEGSLRDVLFLFDRLSGISQGHMTKEIVEEQLGILPIKSYDNIIEAIYKNDIHSLLIEFNTLINRGFNLELFLSGLANYFRNLLLAKDQRTLSLMVCPKELKDSFLEQAKKIHLEFILLALEICKKGQQEYKTAKNPRFSIEVTLISLARAYYEEATLKKKNTTLPNPLEKPLIEKKKLVIETRQEKIEQGSLKSTSSFSIVKALEEIREPIEKKKDKKEGDSSFTTKELEEQWKVFIKEIALRKEDPLLHILKSIQLKRQEDSYKINLSFFSRAAIAEFIKLEKRALSFIRKNLSNTSIVFQYGVREEKDKRSIYSPEEKCAFFIQKNLILKRLINLFNLDYL